MPRKPLRPRWSPTGRGEAWGNWRIALPAFSRIEHPILNVEIGGGSPDRRPSSFSLITDEGFPSVLALLQFPADETKGEAGDPVTVNMVIGSEEFLLFTGEIYAVSVNAKHRNLSLTDGYKKLCDTPIIAAYRKEQAGVILQDTLDSSGISETSITCPSILIHRFSTKKIPAEYAIKLLIKALEEHNCTGLRFFFDEKDTFHFGTDADSGKNEGDVFEFETGKNIIKKGPGWIEVLPLPIRHTQEVIVDGKTLVTRRTDLKAAGNNSRLKLWLRETE
jgi:hypothetical protein